MIRITRDRAFLMLLLPSCAPSIDVHRVEDAPVATLLSPADGALLAEGRVELRGRVSDAQDPAERLFVVWSLRREGGLVEVCSDFALADGTTQCTTEVGVEHTAVALRATDVAGFVGEDEASVVVEAVSAPQVVIEAPQPPGPFYAGLAMPLSVRVMDDDDRADELRVEITSSLDGALPLPGRPDSSGRLLGALTLREGVHTLEVTATDPGGAVGRTELVLAVGPTNQPPTCRWQLPPPDAVAAGEAVEVELVVADEVVQPGELAVELRSDRSGSLWIGTPDAEGRVHQRLDGLALGDHTLQAVVHDPPGAEQVCAALLVVDLPPELTLTSPSDGASFVGPLRSELVAHDNRTAAAALQVSLVSDRDGPLWSLHPQEDGRLEAEVSLSPGSHRLTWTVTDEHGLRSATTRTVTAR